MMSRKNHQETAVQHTDTASLTDDSLFEAGRDQAASIEEPQRTQVYRQWYRTGDDPFSRGFRSYVVGGGSPMGGSRA